MTRVNINSTTHQVEIDHDGADLVYVIEKAQRLYEETRPAERSTPVVGFQQPGGETTEAIL